VFKKRSFRYLQTTMRMKQGDTGSKKEKIKHWYWHRLASWLVHRCPPWWESLLWSVWKRYSWLDSFSCWTNYCYYLFLRFFVLFDVSGYFRFYGRRFLFHLKRTENLFSIIQKNLDSNIYVQVLTILNRDILDLIGWWDYIVTFVFIGSSKML